MSDTIPALQWRYATKKFDSSRKLPEADFEELLEALRLAPSSYGLQPWKFVVVTAPAVRAELRKHARDQPQVTDASHLIVLCARTDVDDAYVKRFVDYIANVRQVPRDGLAQYEKRMIDKLNALSKPHLFEYCKQQVYLALGLLLAVAAHKRIDACPMGGFDSKAFDKILKLKKQSLASVVLCPVGYRAADDDYARLAKVRFEKMEVVLRR